MSMNMASIASSPARSLPADSFSSSTKALVAIWTLFSTIAPMATTPWYGLSSSL